MMGLEPFTFIKRLEALTIPVGLSVEERSTKIIELNG
jgi:hypothetical protein